MCERVVTHSGPVRRVALQVGKQRPVMVHDQALKANCEWESTEANSRDHWSTFTNIGTQSFPKTILISGSTQFACEI